MALASLLEALCSARSVVYGFSPFTITFISYTIAIRNAERSENLFTVIWLLNYAKTLNKSNVCELDFQWFFEPL